MTKLRYFLIVVFAGLALASCAGPPVPGPASGGGLVQSVQTIAQKICGFVPVAETVVGLFGSSPVLVTAGAIASAICGVVSRPSARRRAARGAADYGSINGVRIVGQFAR